jgi:hypothetical protein
MLPSSRSSDALLEQNRDAAATMVDFGPDLNANGDGSGSESCQSL